MTLPAGTWRADDGLDPAWYELFGAGLPEDPQALTAASGMFGAPVPVGDETDAQTKLLARLGRDPRWEPEIS